MGWYPTIDVDTLTANLTDAFWQDLWDFLKEREKQQEEQQKTLGMNAWCELPHEQKIFNPDGLDLYYIHSIEDLKYKAFDSDHMEHIASWLWNDCVYPVFLKHKINGQYVINHNSGDGGYAGIEFVDGVPYDVEVKTVVVRGNKL